MNARIKKRSLLVLLAALALCISGLFAIGFGDRAKAETAAAENFYMENGAYVRYSSVTPGIRFVSHITESYYNELVGKAADGTLKFYTVIENVSNPSSTPSRIEHTQPVEFDGDRLMSLKAALAFRLEDRELTAEEIKLVSAIECKATVFAEYKDKTSGVTVTVQASGDGVIRSMRGVANYALEQSLSEEQQELLKGYLGTRSTDDVQKTVYLADESAVEMFGLTDGAVYIGARKIGDITDGVIDLSAETLATDVATTVYVFDGDNNCTAYSCVFVNPVLLSDNPVVALNRDSETSYDFNLNGGETVTGVKIGGVALESSAYSQSGSVLTISKSAFGASGEKKVVITTAGATYLANATVADYAIGTLAEFKSFWNTSVMTGTVTKYAVLTANIDAAGYDNGGNMSTPVFDGVIDGRGYTISNARAGWNGLFYILGANGVIKNVAFTGIRFVQNPILFGDQIKGRVENCYFETTVAAEKGTSATAVPALCSNINENAVIENVVISVDNRPSGCSSKNAVFNNTINDGKDTNITMATAPKGVYVVNTLSNNNICTTAGSTDLSGIHLYSTIDDFKAEVKALPDGFSSDYWMVDGNGGLVFKSSQVSLMTATLHKSNVAENAARTFVSGSKSDYVIIKDNDGAKMTAAVKFILDNVYKATGVTLKTETYSSGRENGWTSNDKLIVFDNDAFFNKAGLTMPDENLGQGGYYIKTVGNTVFIACAHEDGYQLGAIKFLNETLGYDMLSADCVVYEKSGSTIPDMDITERPDYEYRMVSTFKMPTAVYGMGFNASKFTEMFMSVPDRATGENPLTMHNSFNYLPPSMYNNSADSENYHPKWYSYPDDAAKRQLCYTAHGDETEYNAMVETLYIYLKQIVDANPDMCNITVTQQDNHAYCDCAACKAVVEKYGAISAAYIMFLNDVDDKLQAALESEAAANGTAKREVNVIFFAYHGTKESPTTLGSDGKYKPASADVIMNEHVGVMVAPIESYYTSSFYSQVNIENGETENVKSWSCLTDKIYMWLYDTYFNNYFYPYNTWETIINNYMFCYANNAVYMFNQGQHDQASPSAFTAFKYYIDSKAGVNFNVSYEKLEEKFFRCYFKDAAEPMYAFFTKLKERLSYLETTYAAVDGGINNGSATNALANAEYWPIDVLNEYLGYIDSALASVAKYETTDSATYTMLKNHILAESLFPRYALITLYESSFTSEELTEKRTAFKTDCDALGVTRYGEFASRDLSILYESWGIAD